VRPQIPDFVPVYGAADKFDIDAPVVKAYDIAQQGSAALVGRSRVQDVGRRAVSARLTQDA